MTIAWPISVSTKRDRRLSEIRRVGYAVTEVVETRGVSSIAMRIRDADGNSFAAISVSTLSSRLEGERVQEVVTYIADAVATVVPALVGAGYRSDAAPDKPRRRLPGPTSRPPSRG